jgi:hypothetical protein
MADDDKNLKPGVDKPTRGQYIVGTVVILLFSMLAWWWLNRR